MPTSDERREVAERLRKTRGIMAFVDALGIDVDSDWRWTDVSMRVADLIDPTCKRVSMDAAGNPPFYTGGLALNDVTGGCSVCGYPFGNSCRRIGNPLGVPNYCPNCGARVVSADATD